MTSTTYQRLLGGFLFVIALLVLASGQPARGQELAGATVYLPLVVGKAALPPAPPNTTVYYVRAGGTGNCTTPQSACGDLTSALSMAKTSPQPTALIRLTQGTYVGSGAAVAGLVSQWNDQTRTIILEGGHTEGWGAISTDPALTRIDGQGARRGVMVTGPVPYNVVLKNLTIQNGYTGQSFMHGAFVGGGFLCHLDSVTPGTFANISFENVRLLNNRVQGTGNGAVAGGGAAFYHRCKLSMNNVLFADNVIQGGNAPDASAGAQALGGGLMMTTGNDGSGERATVTGSDVTFTRNRAVAGNGGSGTLPDGQWPDGLGGALSLQFTNATFNRLSVLDNHARGGDGSQHGGYGAGGGLFTEFASTQISDGSFRLNTVTGGNGAEGAASSGGGIMISDSTLTVDRVSLIANRSIGGSGTLAGHGGGGGLYTTANAGRPRSQVQATNLLVADNRAEAGQGQNRWGGGGGLFIQDTDLTLSHGTIARNSVLGTMMAPALIVLHNNSSSSATLNHTIVAEHARASSVHALVAQGPGDSLIMNRILFYGNEGNYGSMYPGATIQNNNPVPSGNPQFLSPGAPNYNYDIGSGSAARNQASGSAVPHDINRDPRNLPDVGADEYN